MKSAVLLVKSGTESLRKMAETTGIPRATLSRWVNNKNSSNFGSGCKTTIPLETEELLVDAIEFMGNLGDDVPGDEWLNLFKSHWHHRLSQRKPEYVTVARAKGLNEEVLNEFFTMLENRLDVLGIKDMPERFSNLDETGLSLDPKKRMPFTIEAQRMHRWYFLQKGKPCTLCFFVEMQRETTCHHMSFTKGNQQGFLIHGWLVVQKKHPTTSPRVDGWKTMFLKHGLKMYF